MKILLTVAVVTLLLASPALAGPIGFIGLYADDRGSSCVVADAPGIVDVHMILSDVEGHYAVQFRAPVPECWTGAVWLGDVILQELRIGDTQSDGGLAVITGTTGMKCPDGGGSAFHYIGKMAFMSTGQAASCCRFSVTKADDLHPEFAGPIMTVCNGIGDGFDLLEVGAGGAYINGDESCDCLARERLPVPTEQRTWGNIKSLYQ